MRNALASSLAVVLVSGCGGSDDSSSVIEIGSVFPLTGELATYADELTAARVAIEQINAAGGVLGSRLRLVTADDQSLDAEAGAAAQRLVDQGISTIIGGATTSLTQEIAKVAVPAQVVVISGDASSAALTVAEDHDYLFRTLPSDSLQGKLLAQRALARGLTTAAVVYVPGAYGEGLAETFGEEVRAGGGTITSSLEYVEGQTSYTDLLGEALADEPGALLVAAYTVDAAQIVEDYTTGFAALDVTLLFGDALYSVDFVTIVGAANFAFEHEGTVPNAEGPHYADLVEVYPNIPAAPYYANNFDAVFLLALAMEQAGAVDGPSVRAEMISVSAGGAPFGLAQYAEAVRAIHAGEDIDYVGASGPVDFDERGDVIAPYDIWVVGADGLQVAEARVMPE